MSDRAVYANANALYLPLGDKSVHMIATSPPYWGLRSYDTGDNKAAELGAEKIHDCLAWARGDEPCGGCYVCNMRTWAREMWRVLADTGVMFLNLGDSYAANRPGGQPAPTNTGNRNGYLASNTQGIMSVPPGLKPKDLCGIPWRVALALQADGWWLRSDIIWAKPNPMPESVTDRATKSHEYIFMLAKSQRYYFDAEAIKEYGAEPDRQRNDRIGGANGHEVRHSPGAIMGASATRNARTVWTIATAPYSGAHYATWPPALVERMVKAGSKVGDVVLDPFAGSGTTLLVARQLGRIGLGFDLSEKYLYENARTRLGHDKLAAWGNGIKDTADHNDMPLFAGVTL